MAYYPSVEVCGATGRRVKYVGVNVSHLSERWHSLPGDGEHPRLAARGEGLPAVCPHLWGHGELGHTEPCEVEPCPPGKG